MGSVMGCNWICEFRFGGLGLWVKMSANAVTGRLIRATEEPRSGNLLSSFESFGNVDWALGHEKE